MWQGYIDFVIKTTPNNYQPKLLGLNQRTNSPVLDRQALQPAAQPEAVMRVLLTTSNLSTLEETMNPTLTNVYKKCICTAVVCISLFICPRLSPAYTSNIYIDALGGTPWAYGDHMEPQIEILGQDIWFIYLGLDGYFTGIGDNRWLEMKDPITGNITDSFGIDYLPADDSYAFIGATLFTDDSGILSGHSPRINNSPGTTVTNDGAYKLVVGNLTTTHGISYDIYLRTDLQGSPDPVVTPEPTTMLLMGIGIVGGTFMRKRTKKLGV